MTSSSFGNRSEFPRNVRFFVSPHVSKMETYTLARSTGSEHAERSLGMTASTDVSSDVLTHEGAVV